MVKDTLPDVSKEQLIRILKAVHDLPIEHEKGHAFKRVPCRSMFDLGAIIGDLFRKDQT